MVPLRVGVSPPGSLLLLLRRSRDGVLICLAIRSRGCFPLSAYGSNIAASRGVTLKLVKIPTIVAIPLPALVFLAVLLGPSAIWALVKSLGHLYWR